MLESLSFKVDLKLNNVSTLELFENLPSITQSTLDLQPLATKNITNITKVFYLKTTGPVVLVLTKGSSTTQLLVSSAALLTDQYNSIQITNSSNSTNANCYIIFG